MDLRQLRQFVAVAEERSFRRAAERLHVSQPPLSVAVQRLEADIGVTLLDRTRHHVRLTIAGEAFLREARRTLAHARLSVEIAQRAAAGKLGTLRLSFVPSAALGVVPAQEGGVHVLQQTGAGVLPVEIRFKDGRPQRVTMTQRDAAFRPAKLNKKALAAALGLTVKDFDPKLEPEYVSTGIFNLMVPLRNRAALSKIVMNMVALRELLGKNGTMAYCFACGDNGKAFSRGMLPWELYEDAGTGSAAGALGAYLVKHGKLSAGHTLNILQGEEMGRPCHIEVEVTQSGKKLVPRVSGAAVKVFEGTIQI